MKGKGPSRHEGGTKTHVLQILVRCKSSWAWWASCHCARTGHDGDKGQGQVCEGQYMCEHTRTPMLVRRNLQRLGPVSLLPEAKRACWGLQGLEFTALNKCVVWAVSCRAWDGSKDLACFTAAWSVFLFLLPFVLYCSLWLWCPVLGTEAIESPSRCPSLCREHVCVCVGVGGMAPIQFESFLPMASMKCSCFSGSLGPSNTTAWPR